MWYQKAGQLAAPGLNFNGILCYAESDDGIHWRKPDLGFAKQYGFDDSLRNAAGFDTYPTGPYKVTYDPFDLDDFAVLVPRPFRGHRTAPAYRRNRTLGRH